MRERSNERRGGFQAAQVMNGLHPGFQQVEWRQSPRVAAHRQAMRQRMSHTVQQPALAVILSPRVRSSEPFQGSPMLRPVPLGSPPASTSHRPRLSDFVGASNRDNSFQDQKPTGLWQGAKQVASRVTLNPFIAAMQSSHAVQKRSEPADQLKNDLRQDSPLQFDEQAQTEEDSTKFATGNDTLADQSVNETIEPTSDINETVSVASIEPALVAKDTDTPPVIASKSVSPAPVNRKRPLIAPETPCEEFNNLMAKIYEEHDKRLPTDTELDTLDAIMSAQVQELVQASHVFEASMSEHEVSLAEALQRMECGLSSAHDTYLGLLLEISVYFSLRDASMARRPQSAMTRPRTKHSPPVRSVLQRSPDDSVVQGNLPSSASEQSVSMQELRIALDEASDLTTQRYQGTWKDQSVTVVKELDQLVSRYSNASDTDSAAILDCVQHIASVLQARHIYITLMWSKLSNSLKFLLSLTDCKTSLMNALSKLLIILVDVANDPVIYYGSKRKTLEKNVSQFYPYFVDWCCTIMSVECTAAWSMILLMEILYRMTVQQKQTAASRYICLHVMRSFTPIFNRIAVEKSDVEYEKWIYASVTLLETLFEEDSVPFKSVPLVPWIMKHFRLTEDTATLTKFFSLIDKMHPLLQANSRQCLEWIHNLILEEMSLARIQLIDALCRGLLKKSTRLEPVPIDAISFLDTTMEVLIHCCHEQAHSSPHNVSLLSSIASILGSLSSTGHHFYRYQMRALQILRKFVVPSLDWCQSVYLFLSRATCAWQRAFLDDLLNAQQMPMSYRLDESVQEELLKIMQVLAESQYLNAASVVHHSSEEFLFWYLLNESCSLFRVPVTNPALHPVFGNMKMSLKQFIQTSFPSSLFAPVLVERECDPLLKSFILSCLCQICQSSKTLSQCPNMSSTSLAVWLTLFYLCSHVPLSMERFLTVLMHQIQQARYFSGMRAGKTAAERDSSKMTMKFLMATMQAIQFASTLPIQDVVDFTIDVMKCVEVSSAAIALWEHVLCLKLLPPQLWSLSEVVLPLDTTLKQKTMHQLYIYAQHVDKKVQSAYKSLLFRLSPESVHCPAVMHVYQALMRIPLPHGYDQSCFDTSWMYVMGVKRPDAVLHPYFQLSDPTWRLQMLHSFHILDALRTLSDYQENWEQELEMNDSVLDFMICWFLAYYCVYLKLKTGWGGPGETLAAMEQGRHAKNRSCVLMFMDSMDRLLTQACFGHQMDWVLPRPSQLFFRGNAAVCLEWMQQQRVWIIEMYFELKCYEAVIVTGERWLDQNASGNEMVLARILDATTLCGMESSKLSMNRFFHAQRCYEKSFPLYTDKETLVYLDCCKQLGEWSALESVNNDASKQILLLLKQGQHDGDLFFQGILQYDTFIEQVAVQPNLAKLSLSHRLLPWFHYLFKSESVQLLQSYRHCSCFQKAKSLLPSIENKSHQSYFKAKLLKDQDSPISQVKAALEDAFKQVTPDDSFVRDKIICRWLQWSDRKTTDLAPVLPNFDSIKESKNGSVLFHFGLWLYESKTKSQDDVAQVFFMALQHSRKQRHRLISLLHLWRLREKVSSSLYEKYLLVSPTILWLNALREHVLSVLVSEKVAPFHAPFLSLCRHWMKTYPEQMIYSLLAWQQRNPSSSLISQLLNEFTIYEPDLVQQTRDFSFQLQNLAVLPEERVIVTLSKINSHFEEWKEKDPSSAIQSALQWLQPLLEGPFQMEMQSLKEMLEENTPLEKCLVFIKSCQSKISQCRSSLQERIHCTHWTRVPLPLERESIQATELFFDVARIKVLRTKTLPKKVQIRDATGHFYCFLIKGHEDALLDARFLYFQQWMNALLKHDKNETFFSQRLYSAVPLAARISVIEWLPQTISLFSIYQKWLENEVIVPLPRGTRRNCPLDAMNPVALYKKFMEIRLSSQSSQSQASLTLQDKISIFNSLVEMTPIHILSNYLLLQSCHSQHFYQCQRQYTASMIRGSLLCYLIGLGDRHLDNILLCQRTGQLIHIDYALCFNQGKYLSVPERVEARLSRNLVYALPQHSVQSMTTGMIERLKEIRSNYTCLETLLQVFEVESVSKKSPLSAIKKRLQGYEMKVEEQIHRVIETALDEKNLAQMFAGWAAWF